MREQIKELVLGRFDGTQYFVNVGICLGRRGCAASPGAWLGGDSWELNHVAADRVSKASDLASCSGIAKP